MDGSDDLRIAFFLERPCRVNDCAARACCMFSTKSPGISPNGARIRGRLAFAGLVSDNLDCGRARYARTIASAFFNAPPLVGDTTLAPSTQGSASWA
ncbi:hypothetical protein [Methylobacterium sp. V23]|uniref:hypothetical protein n=1 Tax=Methylobacterium sp. V23 TaxID=2044878 RepID=UPI000CDB66E6|nr:hypothetical protein [Methylobacterium sp. V23]POR44941.1 hypothetical protein CRT23_03160 [Methylobacterium sp. V23]